MEWNKFALHVLRSVVGSVVLGAGLLGLMGFFLAGKEGFVNLAIWGAALGLVGGFSTGLATLISARYWGAYAGRYGAWWLKHETEGEPSTVKGNAEEDRWNL